MTGILRSDTIRSYPSFLTISTGVDAAERRGHVQSLEFQDGLDGLAHA